jgi:hypothetical protein
VNDPAAFIGKYTEISETAILGNAESWDNKSGSHSGIGYRRISDNEMHLVVTRAEGEVVAVRFERITSN